MEIPWYLAMTAAEMAVCNELPPKCGWMACHFSPYGTGLANLPAALPAGSLLILNDRIPWRCHDSSQILEELQHTFERLQCSALLLDFQRSVSNKQMELAKELVRQLPCPVVVSDRCVEIDDCPVFLSPCPHHEQLSDHIASWSGREIWIDLAMDGETIQLTPEGSVILPLPLGEIPEESHRDNDLHCSYRIDSSPSSIRFTLWRTPEQLHKLAAEAEKLGVQALVGLYQELKEPLSL